MTNRLQQVQQDFHTYEKEHRYTNEVYFEREQRLKTVENELSTMIGTYEQLRDEHAVLNEELTKVRYEFEQIELSDSSHKERVCQQKFSKANSLTKLYFQLIQSMDEAKIYKRKLTLLGNCFKTVVRKVIALHSCSLS